MRDSATRCPELDATLDPSPAPRFGDRVLDPATGCHTGSVPIICLASRQARSGPASLRQRIHEGSLVAKGPARRGAPGRRPGRSALNRSQPRCREESVAVGEPVAEGVDRGVALARDRGDRSSLGAVPEDESSGGVEDVVGVMFARRRHVRCRGARRRRCMRRAESWGAFPGPAGRCTGRS